MMLCGCVTADDLNKQIGGAGLDSSGATVPIDPCPNARIEDISARFVPRSENVPLVARGAAESDLRVGAAIIASSASDSRDGGPGGSYRAASVQIERAIGMNLNQFIPQLAHIDANGVLIANNALKGLQQVSTIGADGKQLTIKRSDWMNTIKSIASATAQDGWTASFAEELGRVTKNSADRATLLANGDLQKKYLIAAYMAAYFHNGAIFH